MTYYRYLILRVFLVSMIIFCFHNIYGYVRYNYDNDGHTVRGQYYETELDTLKSGDNFLQQAIMADLDSARSIWRKSIYSNVDSTKYAIYVNRANIPSNIDNKVIIEHGYDGSYFYDDVKDVDYVHDFINELREGVDVMDIDYALCGDSLVVTVYNYMFKVNKRMRVHKSGLKHLNFIHKYECGQNCWVLKDVSDTRQYYPEVYSYDIIRKCICLDTYYFKNLMQVFIGDHPNENSMLRQQWRDFNLHFDNKHDYGQILFCPREIFLWEDRLPQGMDNSFLKKFRIFDRKFDIIKEKKFVKFFKKNFDLDEGECALSVEFKIIGNNLVIRIRELHHNLRQGNLFSTAYSNFGYFVHRFNCDTGQWEQSYEEIYMSTI